MNAIIKYINKFNPDRISAIQVYDPAAKGERLFEPIVDHEGARGCFYEVPSYVAGALLVHEEMYALWAPATLEIMVEGRHGMKERKTVHSINVRAPEKPVEKGGDVLSALAGKKA